MSRQALASDLQVTLPVPNVLVLSVQSTNGRQAERAVNEVGQTYISYVSTDRADAGIAQVLERATPASGPSLTTQILRTSGIGALCGALLAGLGALITLNRPRRRIRIT